MQHRLTWEGGQDAGVRTRLLCVLRGVFGLQILMEGKEFSVPPVDEIFTLSFSLHLNHKPLGGEDNNNNNNINHIFVCVLQFYCFISLT